MYFCSQQGSAVIETNKQLIYNEVAHNAQDLGAGPFERFDSSPEQKKNKKIKSQIIESKKVTFPTVKKVQTLTNKSSKETGFHTAGKKNEVN